jgi:hypothetical protein
MIHFEQCLKFSFLTYSITTFILQEAGADTANVDQTPEKPASTDATHRTNTNVKRKLDLLDSE